MYRDEDSLAAHSEKNLHVKNQKLKKKLYVYKPKHIRHQLLWDSFLKLQPLALIPQPERRGPRLRVTSRTLSYRCRMGRDGRGRDGGRKGGGGVVKERKGEGIGGEGRWRNWWGRKEGDFDEEWKRKGLRGKEGRGIDGKEGGEIDGK